MHLTIYCEGDTEYKIIKEFLRPFWKQRFNDVEPYHYGGNTGLKAHFSKSIEYCLTDSPQNYILCLIDLYQEPFKIYNPDKMSVVQGYERLQRYLYSQISPRFHQRFGGFPVVMETETWLLGDHELTQKEFGITEDFPETIYHPYAYLNQVYQNKKKSNYKKVETGQLLFRKASAKRVYDDNCPHFKHIIDWLITSPPKEEPDQQLTQLQQEWETQRQHKQNELFALEKELDEKGETLTEADLDRYDEAKKEFQDFLLTYSDLFKKDDNEN